MIGNRRRHTGHPQPSPVPVLVFAGALLGSCAHIILKTHHRSAHRTKGQRSAPPPRRRPGLAFSLSVLVFAGFWLGHIVAIEHTLESG